VANILDKILVYVYITRVQWTERLRFRRRFLACDQLDGFLSEEGAPASLARSNKILPARLQVDFQSPGASTLKGVMANRQTQRDKIALLNLQHFLAIAKDNNLVLVVIATEDRIPPDAA
jgi:hypothetical protein